MMRVANMRIRMPAYLLVLLLFLNGCRLNPDLWDSASSDVSGEAPGESPEQPDRLVLAENGEAHWCVVFPSGDADASKIAGKISSDLSEKTGGSVSFRSYSDKSLSDAGQFDGIIAVGMLSGITQALYRSLRNQDYAAVLNGKYLSVVGWSYDTLYLAKEKLRQSLDYIDSMLYLQPEGLGTVCYKPYPIETLTVGGQPIQDYTIVSNGENGEHAKALQALIAGGSGYILPVVPDTGEGTSRELVVGATARNPGDILSGGCYSIRCEDERILFLYDGLPSTWEQMIGSVEKQLNTVQTGGAYDMKNLSDTHIAGTTVKVMTYNVQNVWTTNGQAGTRDDVTASLILSELPDFVCLQEFDVWYRNSSNGLCGLISGSYTEVQPVGVDPTEIWNPVFYRSDTYQVVDSGYLKFIDFVECTEYNHYGIGTADGQTRFRTMIWAVLENRTDGTRYLVGSLHYSLISSSEKTDSANAVYNVRDQLAESNLVMQKVSELTGKYNCTVLLCGDYNSTRGRAGGGAGNMLQNGYVDTYDLAKQKNNYATTHETGKVPNVGYVAYAIDHIFTTCPLDVESYYVLTDEQLLSNSDHLPTVMQFAVN